MSLFILEHRKLWRKLSVKLSVLLCFVYIVIFGSVSSRQNVHFICKHFMNNSHPALTMVLSAHGGVANVVFDKA